MKSSFLFICEQQLCIERIIFSVEYFVTKNLVKIFLGIQRKIFYFPGNILFYLGLYEVTFTLFAYLQNTFLFLMVSTAILDHFNTIFDWYSDGMAAVYHVINTSNIFFQDDY
jgi:hypothetical protein